MEILKILFVLLVMVIMFKKHINVGHVLTVTALLFGILHHVGIAQFGDILLMTLTSPSSLLLFPALYLINLMDKIMQQAGSQSRLVLGLQNTLGDPRLSMIILPAIIGLLPAPGGAKFSAPMVEEASKELAISKEKKAAINYYYRHLWEFFVPLHPSCLIAVEILQIPLNTYMLIMFPLFIFISLFGLILFRKFPPKTTQQHIKAPSAQTRKDIIEGLSPVLATMVLVVLFHMSIIPALTIVDLTMLVYYRLKPKRILSLLKQALEPRLFYMVFAAMFLRYVLENSGTIGSMLNVFNTIGLNTLIIAIVFPLVIGLLTGDTLVGISLTLPVILSITGDGQLLSMAVLAIISNFIGVLLSPLHLCFIMSVEHFHADFPRTYIMMLIPELLLFITVLGYSSLF